MGPWAAWAGMKWGGWWPCMQLGGLELCDPWGPFQPGPFYDSVLSSPFAEPLGCSRPWGADPSSSALAQAHAVCNTQKEFILLFQAAPPGQADLQLFCRLLFFPVYSTRHEGGIHFTYMSALGKTVVDTLHPHVGKREGRWGWD